jgi:hypothetical protein
MVRDKSSSKDLEPNPRMGKVLAPGTDNVAILRGFIGPSERKGYIRLFASLADTSVSVEIAEADILDTGDVLNNQLGKRIVWVRKGTQITVIKTRTTEYGVRPKAPVDQNLASVRRFGRLHMEVKPAELRDTCVSVCSCGTCQCQCTSSCLHCLPQ